jgi:hypothetical protein
MPEQFQDFTHRGSVYDRPNRKWICGGACEGCPCLLGPSANGRCQAGANFDGRVSGECLPAKSGDLWVCNRVDPHGGDPCEEGPLPDGSCCRSVPKCQPRPTLRRLRGQCVLLACLATVGFLLSLFTSRSANDGGPPLALDAGPLSFSHAFLEKDCKSCHSAPELSPDRLASFNPHGFAQRAMNDGRLCMKCHTEVGENHGEFAFYPHTASPATLPMPSSLMIQRNPSLRLLGASAIATGLDGDQISCTTCHVEHRGEMVDIKTLSNEQCQVCHQSRFGNFEKGHPEFDRMNYPHNRRTRIFFDHYSHYEKHFPEKQKTEPDAVPVGYDETRVHSESQSCTTCHSPSTDSGQMKVNAFENSCAKCHTKNVFSSEAFPVVAIPRVDIEALNAFVEFLGAKEKRKEEQDAGTWFKDYEIQDGFPWPMLLFLDQETRAKWDQLLKEGVDISDLSSASQEQLQTAADVLFGFKQLFVDVSEGSEEGKRGSAELARRLAANGYPDPAAMLNGFPQDAFLRFRDKISPSKTAFLANSTNEAKLDLLEQKLKAIAETSDDEAKKELARDLAVPYAWRELVREMKGYAEGKTYPNKKKQEAPPRAKAPSAPPAEPPSGEESFGDPAPAGEESFGDPAPAGEESFGDPAPAGEESFGDPAPAGEESFGDPKDADAAAFGGSDSASSAEEPIDLKDPNPTAWSENIGGWSEDQYMISYKSTGHSDPLMKAWIEALLGRINDDAALSALRESLKFSQGVESRAAGNCLMCHSIDEKRDRAGKVTGAIVNWHSQATTPYLMPERALTHFNHSAHLLLADCRKCHTTETDENGRDLYKESFPSTESWNLGNRWFDKANPKLFHSNFRQLDKGSCSSCHNGTTADDSCLHCHQYHFPVTDIETPIVDRLLNREQSP